MSKFEMFACKFVLTHIENLLYKLNNEVNAGTDPRVFIPSVSGHPLPSPENKITASTPVS